MRAHRKLQLLTLVSFLLGGVSSLGSAYADLAPESALARWMGYEQKLLHRGVDPRKITQPDIANQAVEYRPDTGLWFDLQSVWVPESELQTLELKELMPRDLQGEFSRVVRGVREYRFFIHPESRDLYQEWLAKYPVVVEHRATATSSSRSVLVQSIRNPERVYFVKLSLNVVLGGADRTIPTNEIARSLGSTLHARRKSTSNGMQVIPEVLGLVPKGAYRGGEIVRLVPPEVLENRSTLFPLFSLYAEDANGSTRLEQWARREGISPRSFVKNRILAPYTRQWVEAAVLGSMTGEDHAQNVLMELDLNEYPTGRFFRRDGGGFYIQPKSPVLRRGELADLPTFSGFQWDYQKFALTAEYHSLQTYFLGGFLYNVDQKLQKIDPRYIPGSLENDFWTLLRTNLAEVSKTPPDRLPLNLLREDMGAALKVARQSLAHKPYQPSSGAVGKPARIGFYTGTFDPPHQGHLDLLEAARKQLGLDIVYVVPNVDTPHKPGATPYEMRKKLSELAFYRDGILIADSNIESAMRRGGTDAGLQAMMAKYQDPDVQFFRITGDDSFAYYLNPKNQFFTSDRVTLVVSRRTEAGEIPSALPGKIGKSPVLEIAASQRGLSSTAMRAALAEGKFPEELPVAVKNAIIEQGMYGTKRTPQSCGLQLRNAFSWLNPLYSR